MSRSSALGESHEVALPQGLIQYRVSGPEAAPVVVFVHGFLMNGDLWRNVVPELAGEYRCVVPDLPLGGHELALDRPVDLTLPGLAGLLTDFLAALDLDDVTLVSNDTGSAVVQMVASEHAERVARIVLTPGDAYDNFPPAQLAYLTHLVRVPGVTWLTWLALHALRLRFVQRLPFTFGGFARRPIEAEAMRSYLTPGRTDPAVRGDTRDMLRGIDAAYTQRASRGLARFCGPALVVWTEVDPLFPPEHGRRLAATMPDGRLVTVGDSYGCVPEDQPQALVEHLREFLRTTSRHCAGRRG